MHSKCYYFILPVCACVCACVCVCLCEPLCVCVCVCVYLCEPLCVCVYLCEPLCVCVCHITSLKCKHLLLCLCLWKDAPSKKKRKRLSTALNSSTDRFSDASLFSIASSTCSLNSESLKDAPASPLLIPTELLGSSTTPPPSSTAPTKTEGHPTSSAACSSPSPVDTARHHITSELLQTERNFVSILRIIVEVSRHQQLKLFALAYAWLMIRHCSPFLLECMQRPSLPLSPPTHRSSSNPSRTLPCEVVPYWQLKTSKASLLMLMTSCAFMRGSWLVTGLTDTLAAYDSVRVWHVWHVRTYNDLVCTSTMTPGRA